MAGILLRKTQAEKADYNPSEVTFEGVKYLL